MSKQRFSSEMLYKLRNDIPVDVLIKKVLKIPSRTIESNFRFLCPLCNEYNSAVNPETNLARCFRCKKNFNTIDLVMQIRRSDFIQSVYYLKHIFDELPIARFQNDPSVQDNKSEPISANNMPVQIGSIFGNIAPLNAVTNYKDKQSAETCHSGIDTRILRLEENIKIIIERISQIEATIKQFP